MEESGLDGPELASAISRLKNAGYTQGEPVRADTKADVTLLEMFSDYEAALRENNQVDFDDLVRLPYSVLSKDATVRGRYRRRYHHLMIDEYQDTNPVQYRLIRCLVGARENLGVFGDDDQAIYGFRGADVTRIRCFKDDYPSAKVIRLETNYRSYEPIVSLANRVIDAASDRIRKRLVAHRGAGLPVSLNIVGSDEQEAASITEQIQGLVANKRTLSDIACLFRARKLARPLRQELKAAGIPMGKGGVRLLTLHESKGLQFPVVFLPGLEDDVLPSWHSLQAGGEAIEEERRLLYVGITRAEDELHLSAARQRNNWSRRRSRFLNAMAPGADFGLEGRYELAN